MNDHLQLIVGLGNPGPQYRGTRHNAGFLVVDELARRHDASFRKRRRAYEARLEHTWLIKPTTFMNRSGTAVQAYVSKLRLRPEQLLIVHDDLDLPLGRLRFKRGGGAGGQNGVSDIIDLLGADFFRLKIGIGRPPEGWESAAWVLSRFRQEEADLLQDVIGCAAEAVMFALESGPAAAMNRYNGTDLRVPEPPKDVS